MPAEANHVIQPDEITYGDAAMVGGIVVFVIVVWVVCTLIDRKERRRVPPPPFLLHALGGLSLCATLLAFAIVLYHAVVNSSH